VRLKKKKKGPQECHCLLYEQLTAEDMGNGRKNRTEWAECAPPPPQVWEGGGGRGQELQRGRTFRLGCQRSTDFSRKYHTAMTLQAALYNTALHENPQE